MVRSRRLATLERLAAMAERGARLRLARANQDLERKRGQQAQLEAYDAEYATRWLAAGRAGIQGQRLAQLASFRQSLGRSLETQAGVVHGAESALAQEGMQWRRQRERLRVFGKLVKSALSQEERAAERRRQRELDDLAAGVRGTD